MARVHVIAGFPGVGKSTIVKSDTLQAYDSDSGDFDKNHFPENYITHIRSLIDKHKDDTKDTYIFCSTHEAVRKALDAASIPYALVYPDDNCKGEYIKRYRDRGSPEGFVRIMGTNFDEWQRQCARQPCSRKFRLLPGQYLSDLIGFF